MTLGLAHDIGKPCRARCRTACWPRRQWRLLHCLHLTPACLGPGCPAPRCSCCPLPSGRGCARRACATGRMPVLVNWCGSHMQASLRAFIQHRAGGSERD